VVLLILFVLFSVYDCILLFYLLILGFHPWNIIPY
ncbi:unnamed protein product, partial [Arabidopsis halleri]